MVSREMEMLKSLWEPKGVTVRELQSMLDLGWSSTPATGLTIAGLPEPEQVHPKRLLAELAEEFDRGIEI